MKVIKGDLIKLAKEGRFDVIIHGVNCQGVMGSGIAKQIRYEFPEAYLSYRHECQHGHGILGHVDYCPIPGLSQPLMVVNAFTQDKYGRDRRYVSYYALRQCFKKIAFAFADKRIGYPKIGADRGDGDWDKIRTIIDEELQGMDHVYVEYDR